MAEAHNTQGASLTASDSPSSARTALLTSLAMVGFAANSVLCRLALGDAAIDAASFSTLRLVSGALTLATLSLASGRGAVWRGRSWKPAFLLFLYAVPFSFAYNSLAAGTGALILFGAVQATMLIAGLIGGERPSVVEWSGLVLAMSGLIYLVFPGLTAPPLIGSALMTIAGIAWGIYSIKGRGAGDPLADTASNFVRSVPFAAAVSLASWNRLEISATGAILAVASGAVASGLGYAVWYAALTGLSATRAASVQLSVPILAAVGGVVFLGEAVSLRLLIAAVMILGGVAIALRAPRPARRPLRQ